MQCPFCGREMEHGFLQSGRTAAKAAFGKDADIYSAWGEAEDAETCYYERSDDYCSTAYWYQTLPSPAFPELPDRAARSADL